MAEKPVNGSAQPPVLLSDSAAMITWFRGEFAAANAIIDELCGHLMEGLGSAEYEGVMAALHRRRLNWIPVLQMQKYHSISQVTLELQIAKAKRLDKGVEKAMEIAEIIDDDSPSSDITDSGNTYIHFMRIQYHITNKNLFGR